MKNKKRNEAEATKKTKWQTNKRTNKQLNKGRSKHIKKQTKKNTKTLRTKHEARQTDRQRQRIIAIEKFDSQTMNKIVIIKDTLCIHALLVS